MRFLCRNTQTVKLAKTSKDAEYRQLSTFLYNFRIKKYFTLNSAKFSVTHRTSTLNIWFVQQVFLWPVLLLHWYPFIPISYLFVFLRIMLTTHAYPKNADIRQEGKCVREILTYCSIYISKQNITSSIFNIFDIFLH